MRSSFDNLHCHRTVDQGHRHAGAWAGNADGGDDCASSISNWRSNTSDADLEFAIIDSVTSKADFMQFM